MAANWGNWIWRTFAGGALIAVVAGCHPHKPGPATPTPTPASTESPTPTPSPTPIYVPSRRMETSRLFNGMEVHATVQADFGGTATVERTTPDSYVLDLSVKVRVPKANTSLEELLKISPELSTALPGLPTLLQSAKVDPFYEDLYRRKVAALNYDLPRLNELLSRHNFFDCETILQFEDATSKRKAVLMQADMDIVMDGSDSDRVALVDGSSANFQPTTSYKWPKRTAIPNPFLAGREQRLKQAEAELATPGVDPKRAHEIRTSLPRLRAEVDDLKRYSYLMSLTDPFVVVPGPLYAAKSPYAPKMGDYCVVIYRNILYPAVVGDVGPAFKTGEASLRIGKELNQKANAYYRPVSELTVSYLIFPGTAEKVPGPPNLEQWRNRCETFLNEIGGYSGTLFFWEDLTKPAPSPTPTPSATPSVSGSSSPATGGSATPMPGGSPSVSVTPTPSPTASILLHPSPAPTPSPAPPVLPTT